MAVALLATWLLLLLLLSHVASRMCICMRSYAVLGNCISIFPINKAVYEFQLKLTGVLKFPYIGDPSADVHVCVSVCVCVCM